MPKTLGSLINHAFTIAGVNMANPELISILSNPALSAIQVADDVAALVESNLHSEGSAKAKFKAEFMNGIDTHVSRIMKDKLKLDDETITSLNTEKNTGARIEKMLDKIADLESKRDKTPDGGKKEKELTDQINSLREQIAGMEVEKQNFEKKKNAEVDQTITDLHLQNVYGEYIPRIAMAKNAPASLKVNTVKDVVSAWAKSNNAVIKLKDGKEVILNPDGTDFYLPNNTKPDFKAIVEGELSRNNLLITNDPEKVFPYNQSIIPGQKPLDLQSQQSISSIDTLLAEMDKNP